MMSRMRWFGLAAAVLGLLAGAAGRAEAGLVITKHLDRVFL